jgi:hypothetical protein
MPPWHAGSGGRDNRSRQIKEDPRISSFLQQRKTRKYAIESYGQRK